MLENSEREEGGRFQVCWDKNSQPTISPVVAVIIISVGGGGLSGSIDAGLIQDQNNNQ